MARIAVDAMGGDNAPREVVEGAILASEDGVDVVLVGDQEAISEVIGDRSVDLDIVHASQVIGFDDDPGHAIRE